MSRADWIRLTLSLFCMVCGWVACNIYHAPDSHKAVPVLVIIDTFDDVHRYTMQQLKDNPTIGPFWGGAVCARGLFCESLHLWKSDGQEIAYKAGTRAEIDTSTETHRARLLFEKKGATASSYEEPIDFTIMTVPRGHHPTEKEWRQIKKDRARRRG